MVRVIEQAHKDLHHKTLFVRESKLVKPSKGREPGCPDKGKTVLLSDGQCSQHAR